MRVAKACLQCRSGKRKCHHQEGRLACDQCAARNITCSMSAALASASSRGSRKAQTAHLETSLALPDPTLQLPPVNPTRATRETLHVVDLYFRYLHDKPHTLFHEPTFKASVADGTASNAVVLGMIGLSARYSTDPGIRSRGDQWGREAKKALMDDLEHICVENTQACILVASIWLADTDPDAESLYLALGVRMAQILDLGVCDERDDGMTREVKRRVWWTCFIVDAWASAGLNLSRQFRHRQKRPRTPMDELTFMRMRPGDPDVSDAEWKPGIWGRMVNLIEIQIRIQDLQRYLAETPVWNDESIEDSIRQLEYEMVAFEHSLAPEMRWSLDNLVRYIRDGLGSVFVAFHIGYQHYCTVLFYVYLDHRRPHSSNANAYADRCKYHAMMVCDILKASRDYEGAEALYNIVGHVLIVSSSVLLHTYLFGHPDELPEARRRLESNLQSLVLLRGYWPSIELMLNRLVTFQNYCIRSLTDGHTHLFDRWMVKFLLAHAKTMEEKTDEPIPDRMDHVSDASLESIHVERSRVTGQIIMDIRNNT